MTDDPSNMQGVPVSVQLVARRLHEEHLLAVTGKCDEALQALRGLNGFGNQASSQ